MRRAAVAGLGLLVTLGAAGCSALFPGEAPAAGADASTQDGSAALLDTTSASDTSTPDTGTPDTGTPDTGTPDTGTPDTGTPDTGTPDTGTPDAGPGCACTKAQVLAVGPCVPTPELGCTTPCQAGACPDKAGQKQVCDPSAAQVSCTATEPAAACVPQQAMGYPAGSLRVSPTVATVGQEVTLTVEGGNFYIGALWWVIGVDDAKMEPAESYKVKCTLEGKWTPKKAGTFAVLVGYGGIGRGVGGGAGGPKGGLAGFVTVGGKPQGVQPGRVCAKDSDCIDGDGWACGCQAKRCACAPE